MPAEKKKASTCTATLTLTIEYSEKSLPDVFEAVKETIDKAREMARVEGYLDLHHTGRIFLEDLQ